MLIYDIINDIMNQEYTRNFSIIAHIDHGKSTLADRLLDLTGSVERRKMQEQFLDQMDLERERGITIKLQPVRMKWKLPDHLKDNSGQDIAIFNLIDTPGHVDFGYEVSRSLVAVEGAVLLVDATKGIQAQTLANLKLAQEQNLVIIPVINKIDLPNSRSDEVADEIAALLEIDKEKIIKISAKDGQNVEQVLERVYTDIPAPLGDNKKPFQALIFDSMFDTYKGVIAFVRVFQGSIKTTENIYLHASNTKAEVLEAGYFLPQISKQKELVSGEIGYIATGLKDPEFVRVGDTVTSLNNKANPLPGYKEPQPVVFASFYPEDSDEFEELRDALEKLRLTDSSLTFEPESSAALGRGFRLGFLGMLHVEIISERLRREFGMDLVISSPSVEYHIKLKNGQNKIIRSASELDPNIQVDFMEEPVVDLKIITPLEYMGGVMQLLNDLRSNFGETDYLRSDLVRLNYKVPLAEIITDFYDKLKSVSSGYASMSYESIGYQPADLVRLDILIAGDLVEPFSRIIPRERSFYVGRVMVEKLKETVPAQLFTVSLQATIGGKIIARETIKAMRKDVTGYLYGGDITRKRKLLEKQKKGKKKMKETGKVNLPQKVFLEMIKR